jgi:hypothetical protein
MMSLVRFLSFLLCTTPSLVLGWSSSSSSSPLSRRDAFQQVVATATTATVTSLAVVNLPPAFAVEDINDGGKKKKLSNLSNTDLSKIITKDMVENQFLVSADITREVYDESATFTDEIDAYTMDKWIKGTKRLFVADKSQVNLEPDSLTVTDEEATFRFTEYLMFNIPFKPTVYLSGKVILKRDPNTGLIISYQEQWDQDVASVLKTAKF